MIIFAYYSSTRELFSFRSIWSHYIRCGCVMVCVRFIRTRFTFFVRIIVDTIIFVYLWMCCIVYCSIRRDRQNRVIVLGIKCMKKKETYTHTFFFFGLSFYHFSVMLYINAIILSLMCCLPNFRLYSANSLY